MVAPPRARPKGDRSIAVNRRFYREGITDQDIERAARQAGLHDEVMAFPDRYDQQVSDRGGNLSGGQQQRVCIARALAATQISSSSTLDHCDRIMIIQHGSIVGFDSPANLRQSSIFYTETSSGQDAAAGGRGWHDFRVLLRLRCVRYPPCPLEHTSSPR